MGLASMLKRQGATGADRSGERVVEALARKIGLNRAGMEVVRDLADASGAPAAALLVSEHAFLVGLAERERAAMLSREPLTDAARRAIASARHQLFGEA